MDTRPSISVVIPYQDVRARPDNLATWTKRQSLAADRFEVIVVTPGRGRKETGQVRAQLRDHDVFLHRPELSGPFPLYVAGVEAASADLLVFTEDHVLADPDCLAAVLEHFNDPDHIAATLRWGHINRTAVARCEERLCDHDARTWAHPDHWNKMRIRGFAMRRTAYERAGGLQPRYGAFAEAALAARLHAQGVRIGFITRAGIRHINTPVLGEIHHNASDYARGECRYCDEHDADFCERYFQASSLLAGEDMMPASTARWFAHALLRLMRREAASNPRAALTWSKDLVRLAWQAALGSRGVRWRARWHVFAARARFTWWWWHSEHRFRAFVDYWRLAARQARIEYALLERPPRSERSAPRCPDAVRQIPLDHALGVYPQEVHGGKAFRWTGPVAQFSFSVERQDLTLTFETAGFRGHLDRLPLGVLFNKHMLPRANVIQCGPTVIARISRELFATGPHQELTLVTLPWVLPGEARRLGLPIVSITMSWQDDAVPSVPANAAA